ncbi:hypothetical protein H0H93_008553 [Arthromyces matolae]|nr:hypothetical protein H0H93_008553 [Arthromyces matolae]
MPSLLRTKQSRTVVASPLFSMPPVVRIPLRQSHDHRFSPYRDDDAENDPVSDGQPDDDGSRLDDCSDDDCSDDDCSDDDYSDDEFSDDPSMDASVDVESSNDAIDERGGNENSDSKPDPAPVPKGVALSRIAQTLKRSSRKKTTTRNYDLIVNEVRLFAQALADDEFHCRPLNPDLVRVCVDDPNKESAPMLELFISDKCVVKGRGKATARRAIYGLMRHWDLVHNGRYGQKSFYVDPVGNIHGNPARHSMFKDLDKGIATRDKDTPPHQATPVTANDATLMLAASLKEAPQEKVTLFIYKPLPFGRDRGSFLFQVSTRAAIAFGLSLWSRYFELANLKGRNVAYVDAQPPEHPHFIICFTDRKAKETNDVDLDPLKSYKIYEQKTIPSALDCYTHLWHWLKVLEAILKRRLGLRDHIFPFISSTGQVEMDRPMSLKQVRRRLIRMARQAGITKDYTTHSLRRGGVQYFALEAPNPWPFKIVFWWAAWSADEDPKMLITYLFDIVLCRENYYGDHLNPNKQTCLSVEAAASALKTQHLQHLISTVTATMENVANDRDLQHNEEISLINNRLASLENGIGSLLRCFEALGIRSRAEQPHQSSALHTTVSFSPTIPPLFTPVPFAHTDAIGMAQSAAPTTMSNHPGSHHPAPVNEVGVNAIRIPPLPKEKGSWRVAVEQWNVPDPQTKRSLREWPQEWVSALKKTYGERETIGTEYKEYGTDAAFLKVYPADDITITELLSMIKERHSGPKKVRNSKNGSPNTRAAKKAGKENRNVSTLQVSSQVRPSFFLSLATGIPDIPQINTK